MPVFTGMRGVACQETVEGSRSILGFTGLNFFASMMQFLATSGMLGYIVITKRRAALGNSKHAQRLVLPAYIMILRMFAIASFLAGIAHLVESSVGQTCAGQSDSVNGMFIPADECCAVVIDQSAAHSVNEALCSAVKYLNRTAGVTESCVYDEGGGPINSFFVGLGWQTKAIVVALDWAVFHVVLEGLALFLMQKGAGARAYWRAITRSLVWGAFTFCLVFAQEWMKYDTSYTDTTCAAALYGRQHLSSDDNGNMGEDEKFNEGVRLSLAKVRLGQEQADELILLWHGLLLVFYSALCFAPQQQFSRRPAAIFYAWFMLVLRAIYVISLLLERQSTDKNIQGVGFCLYTAGHLVLFSLVEPIWVFLTLQRDSEYWRGHTGGGGADRRTGRGSGGNLNVALVGRVSLNEGAAATLADTLDRFHKDHSYVELLNFAYLTIDTKKVVGAGGTAKVYSGSFKGETVAIKLVYPPELTQEEVTGFLREASALEEAGEHENIIKVIGVCVMPPSIALVLEMCEQGDLNSHLRTQQADGKLDHRQQLELALDCATGVDFLHNGDAMNQRGVPIIHNDLKSFNVLVTQRNTAEKPYVAKLADLEFAQDGGPTVGGSRVAAMTGGGSGDTERFQRTDSALMRPPPVPDTVNWTAPELMDTPEGGWPTVESDVWALGMLLFEIFGLEIPFAEGQCEADLGKVRDAQAAAEMEGDAPKVAPFFGREYLIARICNGEDPLRPPLCDDPGGRGMKVPQDLSTLLAACWSSDPGQRIPALMLKDQLHNLLRNAPQRDFGLADLGTMRGVGLPQVPKLNPQYRRSKTYSLPPELGDSDAGAAPANDDGTDDAFNELTDFEARGKFGVGVLEQGKRRPRLHSERGVGLPKAAPLRASAGGEHGGVFTPRSPTGFDEL